MSPCLSDSDSCPSPCPSLCFLAFSAAIADTPPSIHPHALLPVETNSYLNNVKDGVRVIG